MRRDDDTQKHTDMPLVGLVSQMWMSLRTTSIWPIPRPTLEYQASNRLRELATPRIRNNIWSINMSKVGALVSSGAPPSTMGWGPEVCCRKHGQIPEWPAHQRSAEHTGLTSVCSGQSFVLPEACSGTTLPTHVGSGWSPGLLLKCGHQHAHFRGPGLLPAQKAASGKARLTSIPTLLILCSAGNELAAALAAQLMYLILEHVSSSCLLSAESYFVPRMDHNFYIHSPTEGRLSCFPVWAITNKAALKLVSHGGFNVH